MMYRVCYRPVTMLPPFIRNAGRSTACDYYLGLLSQPVGRMKGSCLREVAVAMRFWVLVSSPSTIFT
jgi:hypothetical protein